MRGERPLSENELRAFVRRALREGFYRESFHARHGHPERDITVDDLIHGLQADWTLAGQPEFSQEFQEWKYLLRTVDVDGEKMHVVIAVSLANQRFTVVSKW